MLEKIRKHWPTLWSLGLKRSIRTMQNYMLPRRLLKNPTSWQELVKKGFDFELLEQNHLPFLDRIKATHDEKQIRIVADRYAHNCFDIFGVRGTYTNIPWHTDICLAKNNEKAPDSSFEPTSYFKDIQIPFGTTWSLQKDIKVPWQLARFYHVPVLGLAATITRNQCYANAAKQQIISWIQSNIFCYGIHWFNGMEVAIRAVNWIIGLQWFFAQWKHDTAFMQLLVCNLYDHLQYIEHNWEWYDGRTNNHYLANLVGYAYVCWFFRHMPGYKTKWRWCWKQLLQEFEWQVFPEGTCYEGSTRYHVLVTELFMHGFLIARAMNEPIEKVVHEKFTRMLHFIEYCKPAADGHPIIVGDDDSGTLLDATFLHPYYFCESLEIDKKIVHEALQGERYYKSFGLSITKHINWHVTLRHPAYTQRQPTGHFHRDRASVTVAYKGHCLIVDPGSYVYTASVPWRNYFRSHTVHNTIYDTYSGQDDHLFALSLSEQSCHSDTLMSTTIALQTGIIKRMITVDEKEVRIIDQCSFKQPQLLYWNFTFDPTCALAGSNGIWKITTDSGQWQFASSSLVWQRAKAFVAPGYGILHKAEALYTSREVMHDVIVTTLAVDEIR